MCRRVDPLDFHVPDEIWEAIVPKPYQNRVVCISCFDKFASVKGIQYAKHLNKEVCFIGEMAHLSFVIKSRHEPVCE